jgi:hypothetical protein
MRVDGSIELAELDDRWLLPYWGLQVVQIRVSYQLTLLLDRGVQVEIETEAQLSRGPVTAPDAAPARLVPERQEVVPALALFGTEIASAVAFKSGSLRLVFHTGLHLNVKPDRRYEAWNAHGPDTLRLVCQPGGGVALWR